MMGEKKINKSLSKHSPSSLHSQVSSSGDDGDQEDLKHYMLKQSICIHQVIASTNVEDASSN